LVKKLKELKNDIEILDVSQHIGRLRMVKQPVEIDAIQRAIDITVKTLKPLIKQSKLAKFSYEYEIEAELNKGFRLGGGSGHAFDPIVACGSNACTIHYIANNGQITAGDFTIIDVGAEYDHYAADITRTVIIGQPTRRQQAVYEAVLDVQNYAFDLLRPGILMRDYEQKVEQYMGEKLRELNLIKTINHDDVRKYFPHATSHFLGLNAHDAGDYNHPLEPGVVLAVEPGIYIPEEGIGVRIEDNVVIGQKSLKILTKKIPRDL
jgi:Xaa-Pro aminopeptidase